MFALILNYDQLFRYTHFCMLHIFLELVGAMGGKYWKYAFKKLRMSVLLLKLGYAVKYSLSP